jgi:EmrB/QacA subfamily drug resistance transporter
MSESTTGEAPQRQETRPGFDRTVPLVLAIALFMEQMDSTVIATALPSIALDLDTSPVALKLALTSYLVALAIFIPISGWAADRFGARRVFAYAIAVFVAGSIACVFAQSLGGFVAARFLQGMGGAMMTPVGRLVLVRAVAKADLVRAMAWLTIPALIGPLAGPPVGGFLTQWLSWHWIFLVNVPIGLAGIAFALLRLPADVDRRPGRVDWTGFLLAGTAAAGIVFGFSVVSLPALPPMWGIAAIVAGAVAALALGVHIRRHRAPIFERALFAPGVFRTAIIGANLFRIGVGAVPFLLPLMLQIGFGFTPIESGLTTFVAAAGAISMKFVVGPILRLAGFRTSLIGAAIASAVSIAAIGLFDAATPLAAIMAALFAGGLVRSLFFTSVNALTFAEIDSRMAAQATAVVSTAQQVALAMGVAFAGGLLDIIAGHEAAIPVSAFAIAFHAMAAITHCGAFVFLRLPADAGAAASGHRQTPSRD